jgi:hypothetical protein
MSDRVAKPEREKSGGGAMAAALVTFLLLMPVLYVLSLGPAIWYVNRGNEPGIFETIYYPIAWLYENCEPAQPLLDWYVEIWQ